MTLWIWLTIAILAVSVLLLGVACRRWRDTPAEVALDAQLEQQRAQTAAQDAHAKRESAAEEAGRNAQHMDRADVADGLLDAARRGGR